MTDNSLSSVPVCLLGVLLLSGCESSAVRSEREFTEGTGAVAIGIETRGAENASSYRGFGAEHGSPVRGAKLPPFRAVESAGEAQWVEPVSIHVVRGEVEWVVGKVMEDIGDEFVLVEGAVPVEAETSPEEDFEIAGEEPESSSVSGATLVTAQVTLTSRDGARAWLREMLRVSGYQWAVVGGRWWISNSGLGGHWVYVHSYSAWRVAIALELECIGSWCRAHGEETDLLSRLAAGDDELVFLEPGREDLVAALEGVVGHVVVDGGLVAWGPRWALDWLGRVVEVGRCMGFRLEVPPAAGYREVLEGWAQRCGRSSGLDARVVWVPAEERSEDVRAVLAARGAWMLVARVWSTDLGGSAGFGVLRSAGKFLGLSADETEGEYLARVPWGAGAVVMEETTQWRVLGGEVTVEQGVVVSESSTDSVRTGVSWRGLASVHGLSGWVTWSEGVRTADGVRSLGCEGEVRLAPGDAWQAVCAVSGRSVGGGFQIPFAVRLSGRERRYQVEVRAYRSGGRDQSEGDFGFLWGAMRSVWTQAREYWPEELL